MPTTSLLTSPRFSGIKLVNASNGQDYGVTCYDLTVRLDGEDVTTYQELHKQPTDTQAVDITFAHSGLEDSIVLVSNHKGLAYVGSNAKKPPISQEDRLSLKLIQDVQGRFPASPTTGHPFLDDAITNLISQAKTIIDFLAKKIDHNLKNSRTPEAS